MLVERGDSCLEVDVPLGAKERITPSALRWRKLLSCCLREEMSTSLRGVARTVARRRERVTNNVENVVVGMEGGWLGYLSSMRVMSV